MAAEEERLAAEEAAAREVHTHAYTHVHTHVYTRIYAIAHTHVYTQARLMAEEEAFVLRREAARAAEERLRLEVTYTKLMSMHMSPHRSLRPFNNMLHARLCMCLCTCLCTYLCMLIHMLIHIDAGRGRGATRARGPC